MFLKSTCVTWPLLRHCRAKFRWRDSPDGDPHAESHPWCPFLPSWRPVTHGTSLNFLLLNVIQDSQASCRWVKHVPRPSPRAWYSFLCTPTETPRDDPQGLILWPRHTLRDTHHQHRFISRIDLGHHYVGLPLEVLAERLHMLSLLREVHLKRRQASHLESTRLLQHVLPEVLHDLLRSQPLQDAQRWENEADGRLGQKLGLKAAKNGSKKNDPSGYASNVV